MCYQGEAMLRIGYEPLEGGSVVVCQTACLTKLEGKEAVGHTFHRVALLQSGVIGKPTSEDGGSGDDDAASTSTSRSRLLDDQIPEGVSWKGSKKKKKKQDGDKLDYYKLLGLQNERWMATELQIKKAYQRTALEHHPDKAEKDAVGEAEKERINAHFLQVQEAYENLSDPAKRREFDSVDEFDDSLPESCAPTDFFRVFGPAFRRQSRWSVQQPVPDLGEDAATDREVDRFYKFWFAFKSWREFPHADEEDVEQAEGREHRRWIERFNSKLREKAKKEETKRLKAFVGSAFDQDPRMVRRREEERREKEERKKAKDDKKRQEKEAAAAKANAEAEAKAEADQKAAAAATEAKEARLVERKAMQKERKRLRALIANAEGGRLLDDYDMEQLCEKLNLAQLRALRIGLEEKDGSRAAQQLLLQENQTLIGHKVSEEQAEKQRAAALLEAEAAAGRKKEQADRAARNASWSDEEKRLLEKALTKFPVGTAKRWDQVTAYVRTRTQDEVIDMAKHGLRGGLGAPKMQSFSLSGKRSKTDINSDATARHEVFTDVDVNIKSPASANGAPAANGTAASAANGVAAANGAGSPSPPPASSPHSGDWTEAQQLALVAAMKKFGKEVEDRWERIASEVEGKNKAHCFKRFKELRQTFRAKTQS